MKKIGLGILSAAMILSICAASAFAAAPGGGRFFTDADGDGISDNAGSGCAYVDANGDGICDNRPSGRGCGGGRANGFRGGRGR